MESLTRTDALENNSVKGWLFSCEKKSRRNKTANLSSSSLVGFLLSCQSTRRFLPLQGDSHRGGIQLEPGAMEGGTESPPSQQDTSRGWADLPEAVLLMILERLSAREVVRASEVCRAWNQACVSCQYLWRRLFFRDFLAKRPQIRAHPDRRRGPAWDASSAWRDWKAEYRRLVDTVPKVRQQTLRGHTDEVLHVAISRDGNDLISCSKDVLVIVWKLDRSTCTYTKHLDIDVREFNWQHSWAAEFSPQGSKVMVAGVVDNIHGEIAILAADRGYSLVCKVPNDPYDVKGCWCSEQYFLSGTLGPGNMSPSVWLCSAPSNSTGGNGDPQVSAECYKGLLLNCWDPEEPVYMRYIQCHSRKTFDPDDVEWDVGGGQEDQGRRRAVRRRPQPPDPRFGPHLQGDGDLELDLGVGDAGAEEVNYAYFEANKICVGFMCANLTSVPHQIGFQRVTVDRLKRPPEVMSVEKTIEMRGHVVGMALCPTGEHLYVNVRAWPENAVPSQDQPPPISSQIELRVVDLRTLTLTDAVMLGHRGFTPTENAFYLYLDVSEDFIGSGSEDSRGFIWERRYGTLLSVLNLGACVNCLVFHPKDQDVCVTASDDHEIVVWVSGRRKRELLRNNLPNAST